MPPKKLSGSENRKRKLKRKQDLQKSGKHFADFLKPLRTLSLLRPVEVN
jgi:hypothetical protein